MLVVMVRALNEGFSMKNGDKRNAIVLLQSTRLFKSCCGKHIFRISRRMQKHSLVYSSIVNQFEKESQ